MGAVLAAVVASVVLTACGNQGDKADKPHHSDRMTPLSEVCEGIFDGETQAEAANLLGSDQVSWEPPSKGDVYDTSSGAAEILSRGMNRRYTLNHSCVLKKNPDSARDLRIWFEWWNSTFDNLPGSERLKGTSAAYELDGSLTSRMFVDCQRPDLVEPGEKMYLLRVVISDPIGLGEQSRVRLLNASAKKVTDRLNCKNEIILPEADVVVSEDPRLK
ncbi:hypothetical protein NRF20_28225 [Streptomyces sp. R-74717]|uniref:hypothetical protein n=1 Tax=Streptomyces sp. R-74717 TaxID=2969820 RepID=UPI0039B616E2